MTRKVLSPSAEPGLGVGGRPGRGVLEGPAARVGDERDKLARERAAVDADRDEARSALAERERAEGDALSAAGARAEDAASRALAAEEALELEQKALAVERHARAREAAALAQAAGAAGQALTERDRELRRVTAKLEGCTRQLQAAEASAEVARAGLRARAASPTADLEAGNDERPNRARGGRRVCGGMWRGFRRCPGASRLLGAEPPRFSAVIVLAYLVYLQVDVFLLHGALAGVAVPSGGRGPPPV